MPKAVLIIEMPENCGKCPLNYDTLECIVGDTEGKLIKTDYRDRPERCQLKPLVEAIPIEWLEKRASICIGDYYKALSYAIEDWKKENAGS